MKYWDTLDNFIGWRLNQLNSLSNVFTIFFIFVTAESAELTRPNVKFCERMNEIFFLYDYLIDVVSYQSFSVIFMCTQRASPGQSRHVRLHIRAGIEEAALDAVRPGGSLILAGLAPMGAGTNLRGALITRQEKTVKGSYYGSVHPRRDFPLLVDLYQAGRLDLDQLIKKQYTLRQINEAYADMLSGDIARGVIVM